MPRTRLLQGRPPPACGPAGLRPLPAFQSIRAKPRPKARPRPNEAPGLPPRLGRILVEMGALAPGDLIRAIAMRHREDILLGEILLANRMVSEEALYAALARQFGCALADLEAEPPDPRLLAALGPERCLALGAVPWKRVGALTLIATCHPERFEALRAEMPEAFGEVAMVVASESALRAALLRSTSRGLARRAETRVPQAESCRNWNAAAMARLTSGFVIGIAAGLIGAPHATLLLLTVWAILAMIFNTALKSAAALAVWHAARHPRLHFISSRAEGRRKQQRLPRISILVPLYREREIAGRLVRRLARLSYPRELIEICLVLEEDDTITRATLERAELPAWIRCIHVPHAMLKTKPRALNYALDFCKGAIVGVYDAEDAPEPDQLYKVARRFHEAPPDVACLQGVLDFYNPRQNWLSRCFTIEYASWFRVVLPGIQRLGLVVPLGGTTIFFRREALEAVGGWDAHNVTEDADLGLRLARHGYRTELIPTVTEEEANCRIWPWIRQRSRWLKGYAITWAVHMRNPRRLWREIGARRFFGVQVLFLGALSQFLLAPILWSFWAVPLGLSHPLEAVLSPLAFYLLTGLFLLAEIVNTVIGIAALDHARHPKLWRWVPSLHLYFPLAAIAAYKGVWELMSKPFYWDKTTHGLSSPGSEPRKPAGARPGMAAAAETPPPLPERPADAPRAEEAAPPAPVRLAAE